MSLNKDICKKCCDKAYTNSVYADDDFERAWSGGEIFCPYKYAIHHLGKNGNKCMSAKALIVKESPEWCPFVLEQVVS
jgi:hypothetical protein